MPNVGPTFFSSPAVGDGLTRLQTAFAGASAADVSQYQIGAGVTTNGVVQDGMYVAVIASTAQYHQKWDHIDLDLNSNQNQTVEWFMRGIEGTVDNNLGTLIAEMIFGSEHFVYNLNGFSGGVNALAISLSGVGNIYTDTLDFYSASHKHYAIVFRAAGTYDVYVAGTRIVTARAYSAGVRTTGVVQLGGSGNASRTVELQYLGTRVRREAVYTGASFTPPTTPADWSVP